MAWTRQTDKMSQNLNTENKQWKLTKRPCLLTTCSSKIDTFWWMITITRETASVSRQLCQINLSQKTAVLNRECPCFQTSSPSNQSVHFHMYTHTNNTIHWLTLLTRPHTWQWDEVPDGEMGWCCGDDEVRAGLATKLHTPATEAWQNQIWFHEGFHLFAFFLHRQWRPSSNTDTVLLEAGWRQLDTLGIRNRKEVNLEVCLQGRQSMSMTHKEKGVIS